MQPDFSKKKNIFGEIEIIKFSKIKKFGKKILKKFEKKFIFKKKSEKKKK
jgi:hypothetical protein